MNATLQILSSNSLTQRRANQGPQSNTELQTQPGTELGFLDSHLPMQSLSTVLCHFQKYNNINDNSTSFSPIGESKQEADIMDYLFGVAGHGDSHQASAPGI